MNRIACLAFSTIIIKVGIQVFGNTFLKQQAPGVIISLAAAPQAFGRQQVRKHSL